MAALTTGSVMTVVVVVLEMTANTTHIHHVIERVFAVAVAATKFRVPTLKRKVGVAAMVETRVCPRTRVMAGLALLSTSAFVDIVFRVTAKAGRRCILMRLISVAGQALNFDMFTFEREARC